MMTIAVPAETARIPEITETLEAFWEENGCSLKAIMQLSIAVDELVNNVASYAYPDGGGDVTLESEIRDGSVLLRITDGGAPYDPLGRADPDVTLSAEERDIGGLGIFMVKKSMDTMTYERRDGRNILTLTKKK